MLAIPDSAGMMHFPACFWQKAFGWLFLWDFGEKTSTISYGTASGLRHRLPCGLPFGTHSGKAISEKIPGHGFIPLRKGSLNTKGKYIRLHMPCGPLRSPIPDFFAVRHVAFLQEPLKCVLRHRLRVVESLRIVTAELNKHFSLLRVFHALTDDLHAQLPGHVDDVADDNPFPRPEHPAPHEAAIEFEHVGHQLLQLPKGRIP